MGMRRSIRALILLATLAFCLGRTAPVLADDLTSTTCPGTGCTIVDTRGAGTIGIQLSGSFSATVQFEKTVDGTNWVAWTVYPNGSTTGVTSASATGYWTGDSAGASRVRIRVSAFTSGPVVVYTSTSSARSSTILGGSSGSISYTEYTSTATGNIDDLDFSNASVIRMNNASAAVIRGLKAGTAGQQVTIVGVNAVFTLAHQSTSDATAANRLINLATSAASPVKGGYATYVYDGTTQRWRMTAHDQGAVITAPYSASDFTASGSMTWTVESGDIVFIGYVLKGRQLQVFWTLVTTTTGGTASTQLFIGNGQWGGFTASADLVNPASYINDGSEIVSGYVNTPSPFTKIAIVKLSAGNYALATDNVFTYSSMVLNVS